MSADRTTDGDVAEKPTLNERLDGCRRWAKVIFGQVLCLTLAVVCLGGGVFLAELSFDRIEEMRQLERLPETTASGVVGGEVMVSGTARVKDETVTTPHSYDQVLMHESRLQRLEGSGDSRSWNTKETYSDSTDFVVDTGDGTVVVAAGGGDVPMDADIRVQERVDGDDDLRMTERSIYPSDEIMVVGYARTGEHGSVIEFEQDGDYEPLISMGDELEYRKEQTWQSGGMVVGSVAALLFGVFFLLWVFRVHQTALYLGAATMVVIGALGVQGAMMMATDLRAADESTRQLLEDAEQTIDEILSDHGIDWDGDIAAIGTMQDSEYGSLSVEDRERISGIRTTMARRVQRTNANLYRFPEFAVGLAVGARPLDEIELPPGEQERLEELEAGHEPVVLEPLYGGIALIIGIVGIGWCTRRGLQHVKVKRTVENVPTSPVDGAVYGMTELKGTVEPHDDYELLEGPVTDKDCVCYRYVKKVKKKSSGSNSSSWKTVKDEFDGIPFYCRDDTGAMLVDPDDADLSSSDKVKRRSKGLLGIGSGNTRYYEWAIRPGDELYALGSATVDPNTHTDLMLSNEEMDDIPMILSSLSEDKVVVDRAFRGFGALNVGIVATMVAGMGIAGTTVSFSPALYWTMAAISCGYLFLVLLIMFYNDLVFLRDRVRRGWSNIDVALQKRFDLIEQLSDIVREFLDHEQQLQAELADARTSRENSPDDEPPEQDELEAQQQVRDRLIARVENHPELRGQQLVDQLMEALEEVENDIALMRDGYNDSVERYNNRVEHFPEIIVALPLFFRKARFWQHKSAE